MQKFRAASLAFSVLLLQTQVAGLAQSAPRNLNLASTINNVVAKHSGTITTNGRVFGHSSSQKTGYQGKIPRDVRGLAGGCEGGTTGGAGGMLRDEGGARASGFCDGIREESRGIEKRICPSGRASGAVRDVVGFLAEKDVGSRDRHE